MNSLDKLLREAHMLTEEIKAIDAMAKFLAINSCEIRVYMDKWEEPKLDDNHHVDAIRYALGGFLRQPEPIVKPAPVINLIVKDTVALKTLQSMVEAKRARLMEVMSQIKSIEPWQL